MDVSITPRLRMSRHTPQYDRSSNLASTSEAGPSRLPNFSQILDLDLKDIPLSDDQFSSNEQNTPKITTTPTATRPDNPAVVLRALLSRLPAHPPSPTKSSTEQERESDFDTVSESNVAPSIAQESLKHIFSNALRDPGNTPRKARRKRNSVDSSELEGSVEKERAKNKGKRRSVSDDEVENLSQSINHRDIRLKSTSQPITMDFLQERFSDSHNLRTTEDNHKDDSSDDTATILRDSDSQTTPPAATSTPQQSQSLRPSTSSSFQSHSNLLDRDSEMWKVVEDMDSYDVTHGQNPSTRAFDSSKALQTSPLLRHHSKPTFSSNHKLARDQSHSMDDLRSPSQLRERFHTHPSRTPSPALKLDSHHNGPNVFSDSRTKPPKDRSSIPHSEQYLSSEVDSTNSRLSPLPRTKPYRLHSPSSPTNSSARSLRSHDDDFVDVVHERQRNWNSPRPIWYKPSPSPNLPKGRASPSFSHSASSFSPPTNGHIRTNSVRISKHSNGHHHDHQGHTDISHISNLTTRKEREQPSRTSSTSPNGQLSPIPNCTSSLQVNNDTHRTDDPNLRHTSRSPSPPVSPTQNKGSQRLKNEFKTPSPPKGLPDLPTPSSSDESENQPYRNIPSGSKQLATPKPPGGWLNTPKHSREVMEQGSPSDDAIQRNGNTPAADDDLSFLKTPARAEATHGFQSSAKTPKPPGGWMSTPSPAPIPTQSIPVDSPLDIPVRNQGLLTPVPSFSRGSKLEPKTPAAPGAWLATPAVKKSILKVRFEPEVSKFTDKSESGKHPNDPDPSSDSSISGVNGLDNNDNGLQLPEELSSKSPSTPRRQKSPKPPKIRVLDSFGRDFVEDTEAAPSPSHFTVSRGELLTRIRSGLDDLVVGIDDLDKDDQPLSIDHDRVQELTTISSQSRGLREKLISQVDSSRASISSKKASWFPANSKFYIFLIILQLSLTWLVYRISINRAEEFWLNRYYDPFNPELYLYIVKSDPSIHVLGSEGARTTTWSSLVGHIWDGWIYFIGNMQFLFWEAWDNGPVLRYDNAWTPT